MMIRIIISGLFSLLSINVWAQRISAEEYIAQYKDIAMAEMKRSGVPASVTLAQGILETESGNSELVKKSNNHFGIKCKTNWVGPTVYHDDDESGECFRAYETAEQSYKDHSDFLRNNQRYASLFKLDVNDYVGWAKGLKKAGYATNPQYPNILIRQVELYNLQQYNLAAQNISTTSEAVLTVKAPIEVIDESETIKPDVITSINNVECVYIKKGSSLLATAVKYKVKLNRLLEYNELEKDGLLEKDQYVFLHKKLKTGDKDFYIVKQGETLYDVAQKNGILLQHLKEYNYIRSDETLKANSKLFLKPAIKFEDKKLEQTKTSVHLVEVKEGLYSIARRYKVTVQQLKEWNNLSSENLKPGQELIVSK